MSATVTTRARSLRPGLAQFEQFMRDYVKPPVGIPFQSLVTNGTFDTDSDFVKGAEWTIGSGVASKSGTAAETIDQNVPIIKGRHYLSGYTVSNRTTGSVRTVLGSSFGVFNSLNGSYTQPHNGTATGPTLLSVASGSSFDGDIDDLFLWEANPANDNPWLRLPYGMTVDGYGSVYRDNDFLQRDEYYLRNTGDPLQWFVEPKTVPGASTRFEVFCSEVRQ